MKIIGLLSWFNESPSWLAATIASFARVCDHVVAVDGRYALFQHDMAFSPVAEAETIMETAEGAGISLTLHRPMTSFWGNEVEKRNLLLALAMIHAEPMEDWLFVMDGDEYVVDVAPNFRDGVADTTQHLICCSLEEYCDPDDPVTPLSVAKLRSFSNVSRCPVPRLFRALPGIAYVGTHYTIGGYDGDEWTWLWGHPDRGDDRMMLQELVIRHRNPLRTIMRREQAASYYHDREQYNIEVPPG